MDGVRAAQYVGVSKQRIYALRDEGRMGVCIAGIWFYAKTDLDHYIATSKGKRGRRKGYNLPENKVHEEKTS